MLENNIKALSVVLTIALVVFWLARPICMRFMSAEAFAKRRNAWVVLTITAFLSPNFWLFVGATTLIMLWIARDETNPLSLFVFFVFVIPPIRYGLGHGTFGIADLNIYRLLALLLLLPWMIRHWSRRDATTPTGQRLIDGLIVLFGVIHVATMAPYEPFTRTTLHSLLFVLDAFVIYYVASRACVRREQIVEVLASLCLACAILASLGAFEALRTWPLYGGINVQWNAGQALLFREGALRASVTTGHALGLGYFTGIGFGIWLYLSRSIGSWKVAVIGMTWMWMGLIAALSRAPWLMAVLIFFAFAYFGSRGLTRFFKAALTACGLGLLVLMSPHGDRVIDLLPFVGTVESRNVEYRQQLLDATWGLVRQNPWFGNRFVTREMTDMLNGQGIVDLVNAYASVALFYGLVGLTVFCAFQVAALAVGWAGLRRAHARAHGDIALGGVLIACMLGTIFYQLASGPMWMQYVFIGLLTAYAGLTAQRGALGVGEHGASARDRRAMKHAHGTR